MINELRLGNLLKNSGSLMKVVSLDIRYKNPSCVVVEKLKGQHTNVFRHDPIPITEEWLLRMGLEKHEFDNGKPNQYRFKEILIVIRDSKFVDYGSSVVLPYVHTLQNLYFALTGEELEIKSYTMS